MSLTTQTKFWIFCGFLLYSSIHSAQGFQCTSCSYAWDKDNPDGDRACIDQPEIYTGNTLLTCRDYCVVRETYDVVKDKVIEFWRSCSDKPGSGYCDALGTEMKICHYACQSDKCVNWIRGDLHTYYGDTAPPDDSDGGATTSGLRGATAWLTVGMSLLVFSCLRL